MKQRVGRHLVELLIVALAIAVVATAIIMVDIRAGSKARELRCVSNVHQLAVALQQYTDDHDGTLPLGPDWQTHLMAYSEQTKDPQMTVLTCPERTKQPGFAYGLNYDIAAQPTTHVERQVWLIEVRNGSGEIWWANDIRFRRLERNRFPVAPHHLRAAMSRGDGSIKPRDPQQLTSEDWLPPVRGRGW